MGYPFIGSRSPHFLGERLLLTPQRAVLPAGGQVFAAGERNSGLSTFPLLAEVRYTNQMLPFPFPARSSFWWLRAYGDSL